MKGVFTKWIMREGFDDVFSHGVTALRHPDLAAISSFADNARETFPDEPAIEALQLFVSKGNMTYAQLSDLTDTPYYATTSKDAVYGLDLRTKDAKVLAKLVGIDVDTGNWSRRYGSHKEILMLSPIKATVAGSPTYVSPPQFGERWFTSRKGKGRANIVSEISVEYVARVMYELGMANFCHALAGAYYFRFGDGFEVKTV